ncbi:MAG: carbohydrate ABC transporter permease [Eubacteriales bacterium]|nr:carbohydrate ABC transporter permease [Eubacteriales bacterium]
MYKGIWRWMRKSKGDFVLNVIIVLFCLLSVFPIYWLLTGSIKLPADVMKIPPDWIPVRVTLEHYRSIFSDNPAWRWIYNSFATALLGTAGIIMVSSAAGYGLSKLEFTGKKMIFAFVIAALVLPKEVYLLPLYQEMISFGWRGTFKALIFPDLAMPFGVFLLKQFYDGIPNELGEAAQMDGCGSIRFFFLFGVPLSKPGIGALGILAFIRMWNAYLWQYTMATDSYTYTLPVGIARLMDNPDIVDYGLKFAGASVAAIPLLIIFIFFQRYFTSGITAGAIKG